MKPMFSWFIAFLIVAGWLLSACGPAQVPVTGEKAKPAKVEKIDGSDFKRVTLTEKAAARLDIHTTQVINTHIAGQERKVIPYAAVLYGLKAETWAYTNPEPLVYIRQAIVIDHIDGDLVVLTEGPEVGTEVVTVGAAVLYGTEVGVSK